MRINEIIQPKFDKELLSIEALKNSVSSKIYDLYSDNKTITKNYTEDAIDVFSFSDLNNYIILMNQLKNNVANDIGIDSETYKIIDFLENYFRY
jgi:hypothetical protein